MLTFPSLLRAGCLFKYRRDHCKPTLLGLELGRQPFILSVRDRCLGILLLSYRDLAILSCSHLSWCQMFVFWFIRSTTNNKFDWGCSSRYSCSIIAGTPPSKLPKFSKQYWFISIFGWSFYLYLSLSLHLYFLRDPFHFLFIPQAPFCD